MRGRKPVPPGLKLLRGNPGKRPVQMSVAEPTAGAGCPEYMRGAAREEWMRLQAEMLRLGILTELDHAVFAVYCSAWADFEWACKEIQLRGRILTNKKGKEYINPAVLIMRKAMGELRACGAEFGFSPVARGRVHMPGQPGNDDPDHDRFFGPHRTPPPKKGA